MNQKNTKVQNGGAGGPGGPRGVPMGKPEEIKKTIGRVFGYLKGFRLHMTIVAICLLVNAASSIACTYFSNRSLTTSSVRSSASKIPIYRNLPGSWC